MSFYHLPHPYNPGYAIPEYVLAEPPGRGTLTTRWIPRGTISSLVPDYLMRPRPGKALLGRSDVQLGSEEVYELESIGDDVPTIRPGSPGDPIANYGKRGAAFIMREIRKVQPADRLDALAVLLNALDPSLFNRAEANAEKLVKQGMGPYRAYETGLAAAMSSGMTKELVDAGKRGYIKPHSQIGLGVYDNRGSVALGEVYSELGLWGAIKSVGKGISNIGKGAVKVVRKSAPIAGAALLGGPMLAGAYVGRKPIKKAGEIGWKGVKEAGNFVKKGLEKLGPLACGVAKSPVAPMAAAGGAAAFGAPPSAGAMGAQVASAVCTKEEVAPAPPQDVASSGMPSWALPAAIGGGALLLVLALKK